MVTPKGVKNFVAGLWAFNLFVFLTSAGDGDVWYQSIFAIFAICAVLQIFMCLYIYDFED